MKNGADSPVRREAKPSFREQLESLAATSLAIFAAYAKDYCSAIGMRVMRVVFFVRTIFG